MSERLHSLLASEAINEQLMQGATPPPLQGRQDVSEAREERIETG